MVATKTKDEKTLRKDGAELQNLGLGCLLQIVMGIFH